MTGETGVGFSRRIRLEWLDYTANLFLAGNRSDAASAALRARLAERFSRGDGRVSGNRNNAVAILDGLDRMRRADAGERLLVHWCMCIAAYPFFGAVTEAAGRRLRLQGIAAAQAQRRLCPRPGEPDTCRPRRPPGAAEVRRLESAGGLRRKGPLSRGVRTCRPTPRTLRLAYSAPRVCSPLKSRYPPPRTLRPAKSSKSSVTDWIGNCRSAPGGRRRWQGAEEGRYS